jgi:tetratricopeptide (TPR) repeat protein
VELSELPERARQVFLTLCCLEEGDRLTPLLRDADDGLAVLAEHGLIEFEGRRVHLRPDAARAGRAVVDPEFERSVCAEFAAEWGRSLQIAQENGQNDVAVRSALAAAPYLRRLGLWHDLAWLCDTALSCDRSPATVESLLPFAEAAAEAGEGLTGRALHARMVTELDRDRGVAMSRALLAEAVAAEDFFEASWAARDVSCALRAEGRLDEALALARQATEYTARAGFGPWSRAAARFRELQIRSGQGDDRAVLAEARLLLAGLPETSQEKENTTREHVRGLVLELASNAAAAIGDHAAALEFTEQVVAGMTSENTPTAKLVRCRYVLATRLMALGRDAEAQVALEWCRSACADVVLLVQVIDALSEIEDRASNHSRAIELKAEALRYTYAADAAHEISKRHHDLAVLLGRVHSASPHVLAHYFASAAIALRSNAPTLGEEIEMLAMFAFAFGLPERMSLNDDICALVEEIEGVRLWDLLERLPQSAPDDLSQLVTQAMTRAHEVMRDWSPLMTTVVLRAEGDDQWADRLEAELAAMEQNPGAARMARALRRVVAGERGPDLLDGLGMLPFGIVAKILATLRERAGS